MRSTRASASGAKSGKRGFPNRDFDFLAGDLDQLRAGTGELGGVQPAIVVYVEVWRDGFEIGKMDRENRFHPSGGEP